MKKKSTIGMGPGAASLILIFVMLSMSVLSMLSLMNSRSDSRLGERSLKVAEDVYALNERAEKSLASLDQVLLACGRDASSDAAYLKAVEENLPETMELSDREISWTEEDELRTLDLAVELLPLGEKRRTRWIRHSLTAGTGDIWN